ncbi:MAG TPA: hypothetical protein VFA46_00680 [Actinomycetes bacterium]|jgi:hypothetical protein|nr:hypothetical protein [Actinomycetes bacterium]
MSGPGATAARLVGCTMLVDLGLSQELASTVDQVEAQVTRLEATLGRFAGLEARLERATDRAARLAGHEPSDEELAWIWDLFGTTTVRPLLERLDRAHPDSTDP